MKQLLKKAINSNRLTRSIRDNIRFAPDFTSDRKHTIKYHKGRLEGGDTQYKYDILMTSHALEKGMSFDNPRPFGKAKVKDLIQKLEKLAEKSSNKKDSTFVITINTLRQYLKFYEAQGWQNEPEYSTVKDFVSNYSNIKDIDCGVKFVPKTEVLEGGSIDYEKFLKSRHSIRKFAKKRLSKKDIERAVDIARLSPSACNRQMVKVYYAKGDLASDAVKNAVKQNLSGFDLKTVHPFVITSDVAAFDGPGNRHQGWFNAGLFAMNLVNAFHSLGIGTCFCQYNRSAEEERALKAALNIPDSERVAVVLMAGYYCDQNKIYTSPRISTSEILHTS